MAGEVEQQNDSGKSSKEIHVQAQTDIHTVKVTDQSPLPEPEPVGNTGLTLHPLPVGVP